MITLFLVLHVAGAVVALGFSLAYAVWIARGEATGPAERAFALRTVSWIDRRMTTPAYVLQLVTGLVLVWLLGWTVLRQSWLEISLVLYVALTVLAITRYAPMHRRRSALAVRLAAGEAVESDYAAAAAQAQRWGIVVTVLTVAILVLMVWKPIWW
jgi:uncharacterized membrane protein